MSLPASTIGAVLHEYGKAVELEEIPVPPLQTGCLVVEVVAATVCGTDVHLREGELSARSQLPVAMGHEYVGRVVGLNGRDRDSMGRELRIGDQIVFAYPFCGRCYWCAIVNKPTRCRENRRYGWGPITSWPHLTGGFARHMYVRSECGVLRLPDGLDPFVVASTTCAGRTVMHAYERLTSLHNLEFEDHVVVLGVGPVGLYAVAVARAKGVRSVIAVDAPDDRLALARDWGADVTLSMEALGRAERQQAILDATDGRGADVVIDCAGPSAVFADAMRYVRDAGTVLEIGATGIESAPAYPQHFNVRMVAVTGSISGTIRHYARALSFIERFKDTIDFRRMISPPRPLTEVNAAIDAAQTQAEIKPSVAPQT